VPDDQVPFYRGGLGRKWQGHGTNGNWGKRWTEKRGGEGRTIKEVKPRLTLKSGLELEAGNDHRIGYEVCHCG